VRDVLGELNRSLGRLYASEGRPSIPPEQLLSALLLQVFYGIRSERQLMEQLDYNLLYRWFVGLSPDDPISGKPHLVASFLEPLPRQPASSPISTPAGPSEPSGLGEAAPRTVICSNLMNCRNSCFARLA
jgi:hypothetical protein